MTDRIPLWERLLVGIAAPLSTAGIIGLWSAMDGLGENMQRFGKNQAVMQAQMADVRAGQAGIYLRRDAEQKHDEIFRTNQHQYSLIADLEQRLRKLEAR